MDPLCAVNDPHANKCEPIVEEEVSEFLRAPNTKIEEGDRVLVVAAKVGAQLDIKANHEVMEAAMMDVEDVVKLLLDVLTK